MKMIKECFALALLVLSFGATVRPGMAVASGKEDLELEKDKELGKKMEKIEEKENEMEETGGGEKKEEEEERVTVVTTIALEPLVTVDSSGSSLDANPSGRIADSFGKSGIIALSGGLPVGDTQFPRKRKGKKKVVPDDDEEEESSIEKEELKNAAVDSKKENSKPGKKYGSTMFRRPGRSIVTFMKMAGGGGAGLAAYYLWGSYRENRENRENSDAKDTSTRGFRRN
ncbi:MAG: hypothetical protein LBU15_04095 [Rickettsiales bacterium]|jgi:hypothetical protein|nr:hypothetical protein [Rickettsiales bacterium]